VFNDLVLRLGTWKKKSDKKVGQSKLPKKSLYAKYTSNRIRRCSSVSIDSIVKSGVYEECGSLGMEHWNETKRKNFCCMPSILYLWKDV
jgi:hypothetical protein